MSYGGYPPQQPGPSYGYPPQQPGYPPQQPGYPPQQPGYPPQQPGYPPQMPVSGGFLPPPPNLIQAGVLPAVGDGPIFGPEWVFNYPFRWVLKDKFWQLTDGDQAIYDAYGRKVLKGSGKFFSLHDDTTFCDMNGNPVAKLKDRLLSIGKQYKIYNGKDQAVATLREDVFSAPWSSMNRIYLGNTEFKMNGDPVNPEVNRPLYKVKGTLDFSFKIYKADGSKQVVAQVIENVNFKTFLGANTYILECAPGVDSLLMLMITTVVEHIVTDRRK